MKTKKTQNLICLILMITFGLTSLTLGAAGPRAEPVTGPRTA